MKLVLLLSKHISITIFGMKDKKKKEIKMIVRDIVTDKKNKKIKKM